MPNRHYVEDLEFDLPSALLTELVKLFEEMPVGPLTETEVAEVPDGQGVYQLFHREELVYIGKTDAQAGLRARLNRHARKIQGRRFLSPQNVAFKAVRVYVFTAMDLEELLISYYKNVKGVPPAWNFSGFGANDPGRRRDKTQLKTGHFDRLYPIDLDIPLQDFNGTMQVARALQNLKSAIPYNIRFQTVGSGSRRPHPDLLRTSVTYSGEDRTVRNILIDIKSALGPEWQITALPGYVIVYREREHYPDGEIIDPPPAAKIGNA